MPIDVDAAAGLPRLDLIGRTEELTQLSAVADRTLEGAAQLVLVSGDAGIGKSSLVNEFVARLGRDGWGGHVGHCIEYADRPLPFGPVVNILRSVLLDHLDEVDQLIGRRRADLASLLPELGDEHAGRASLAGDVDRLFDAISTTLVEASQRRPVVVVIEDIHWADAATRDLLASLVHSLGRAPILLIATERRGAVGRSHPLRTWLAEQRRFPNVTSVVLEGLSRDELAEQATTILGYTPDDVLVENLVERSGGNPYFAHELLLASSDGTETLPSSLSDFLTSRLERLADEEREVLRAIAVAGGAVNHTTLVAMLPELPVGAIVRNLFDASMLVIDGSDYTFWHALLRAAILGDLLPFETEDLHRRAAGAITVDPSRGSSPSDLANLALHWGYANDPDKSLTAAVEAADASAAVAAYEAAAEMALPALRAWDLADRPDERTDRGRDQLLLQAAEWLASCYRGAEAVELITGALDGWAKDLPASRRALLMARMSPIDYHLGHPTEATELLAEAERLVGDEVSPEAAQVHHRISKQALADGQIHPALEAAERAIEIAEAHGPTVVLVEAMTTRALAIGVTQDLEAGVALAQETRRLALAEDMVSQVANTYHTEMLVYLFRQGRTEACLEASRQGLDYAERHCGPRWRAEFRLDLCLGYVEAGRLNDAPPLFEELLASKLDDLRRLTVLQAVGFHGLCTGSLDVAETFLTDATQIADRYQSAQETGAQNRLLAELARRQGQLDEAIELIDQALKLQLAGDNLTYTRESIIEKLRIVQACIGLGRDDVAEMLANVTELVRDFDGPGQANVAFRSLMDLELASLRQPIDAEAAAETIELLESSGYLYEAAQTRLLVIDQLVRSGADRPLLERAVIELAEIATTHGIAWIADRVALLAKVARVKVDLDEEPAPPAPPGTEVEYPHGLTARELEVLSLLAEGLTNKAIGERLYVSPRTVSTHVSNLLAKLGVANRGEAAAAYHRLGLGAVIDLRDRSTVD
ncbi:MAG: helix-turn-helix transcriptional regulator [Acidimicrobiales bacterium]